MARPARDITGQDFGRWHVESYAGGTGNKRSWNCVCTCGTRRVVQGRTLIYGGSTSCGCSHQEAVSTHGHYGTRVYRIWQGMKTRCGNATHRHYRNYGGRGVKVCDRWAASFEAFLSDMGEPPTRHHTIDRYPDKDGNYEPGNCRWATAKQQGRNTRKNRNLTHDGQTLTVTEWAERIGLPAPTLYSRIRRGLSVHLVLSPIVDPARSAASRSRR